MKKTMQTPVGDRREGFIRGCVLLLLAITVLAVPTLFLSYTTEAGRVKQLVMHLAVAAMLALMAIQVAWTGRLRFPKHLLHIAVGVWLLVNAISTAMSPFPYSSMNELWRVAMLAGLYAATVYAVRSVRSVQLIAWLCVLAMVLVVGYGIAQITGHDFVIYGQDPTDRMFSSLGNPNMLAGFLILMFWVVVGLALDSRRWPVRIVLALLVVAVVFCLIMTKTKGAWIAMAVSCVIAAAWFAAGWRFPYAMKRGRRPAILAAIIAVAALFSLLAYHPIQDRLRTLESSVAVRKVYWTGTAGVIRDHPFLGAGAGTFQVVYPAKRPPDFRASSAGINTLHAHSEPLEVLAELGIVGLLSWLLLLFVFYRGVLRTLSPSAECPVRGLVAGMALGIVALLLHNLVDVNLRWPTTPTYFWMFLGLSAVAPHMASQSPGDDFEFRLPGGGLARWGMALVFLLVLGGAVKVRVIDSWRSEVNYRQGCLLYARKDWSAAFDRQTRAIELDPSNLRARYHQANYYLMKKQYTEGIRAHLRLEQLAPDYCQSHDFLGIMYALTGQWERAAERFVKAQKSGAMSQDYSAAVHISAISTDVADKEKSLAGLLKVAELLPSDATAQVCLGNYYGERDERSKAGESFQKALDIDDTCIPALSGLAAICFFDKEYSRTAELCERILEIKPELYTTRINLGRAYRLGGQREKAAAEWRRVLRENPNATEARMCLEELGLPAEEP